MNSTTVVCSAFGLICRGDFPCSCHRIWLVERTRASRVALSADQVRAWLRKLSTTPTFLDLWKYPTTSPTTRIWRNFCQYSSASLQYSSSWHGWWQDLRLGNRCQWRADLSCAGLWPAVWFTACWRATSATSMLPWQGTWTFWASFVRNCVCVRVCTRSCGWMRSDYTL